MKLCSALFVLEPNMFTICLLEFPGNLYEILTENPME